MEWLDNNTFKQTGRTGHTHIILYHAKHFLWHPLPQQDQSLPVSLQHPSSCWLTVSFLAKHNTTNDNQKQRSTTNKPPSWLHLVYLTSEILNFLKLTFRSLWTTFIWWQCWTLSIICWMQWLHTTENISVVTRTSHIYYEKSSLYTVTLSDSGVLVYLASASL
jgi:hypothetical protein